MDLIIGPEILKSYKRLSYKVWYAFAEFIDNSTQAFENNKDVLEKEFDKSVSFLTVDIIFKSDSILINDNSMGMNEIDLENALRIGIPPKNVSGRSKYGLGLKTAAFWFGNSWTVTTKKFGEVNELSVELNIDNIIDRIHKKADQEKRKKIALAAQKEFSEIDISILELKTNSDVKLDAHYTKITITNLNHTLTTKIKNKSKEYLRSIYRYDLQNDKLILNFDGERLSWSKDEFIKRLLKDDNSIPFYKEFSFAINGKEVRGWAGVLAKGSRKDAGFSLFQASRVIQGWPNGYKPTTLFGDQDGGINNLINQRLIGELFLDQFNVSHTKDEILFEGDEEDQLDTALYKILIEYKRVAEAYRARTNEEQTSIDFEPIISEIFGKLQEPKFRSAIKEMPVLSHKLIIESNQEVFSRAKNSNLKDTYLADVGGIKISIFINDSASVYDPYLVVNLRATEDSVGIVINKNHPHWSELNDLNSIFQFIKDCVLDGIAEWKANKMADSLEPDTIKYIKDIYLREIFNLK